jgi:hypothetical protein
VRNIVEDSQFLSERAEMCTIFKINFTSPRKLKFFIQLQESSNLKSITITGLSGVLNC